MKTGSDPMRLVEAIEGELWAIDPRQPLDDLRRLDERVGGWIQSERVSAVLLGGFAALALVLASVGIYGVVSHSVVRRRREIGIRMALGALPGQVLEAILRDGAIVALIGVGAGSLLAYLAAPLAAAQLYGVDPRDPTLFLALALVLVSVALLASAGPALWASRLAPVDALRDE